MKKQSVLKFKSLPDERENRNSLPKTNEQKVNAKSSSDNIESNVLNSHKTPLTQKAEINSEPSTKKRARKAGDLLRQKDSRARKKVPHNDSSEKGRDSEEASSVEIPSRHNHSQKDAINDSVPIGKEDYSDIIKDTKTSFKKGLPQRVGNLREADDDRPVEGRNRFGEDDINKKTRANRARHWKDETSERFPSGGKRFPEKHDLPEIRPSRSDDLPGPLWKSNLRGASTKSAYLSQKRVSLDLGKYRMNTDSSDGSLVDQHQSSVSTILYPSNSRTRLSNSEIFIPNSSISQPESGGTQGRDNENQSKGMSDTDKKYKQRRLNYPGEPPPLPEGMPRRRSSLLLFDSPHPPARSRNLQRTNMPISPYDPEGTTQLRRVSRTSVVEPPITLKPKDKSVAAPSSRKLMNHEMGNNNRNTPRSVSGSSRSSPKELSDGSTGYSTRSRSRPSVLSSLEEGGSLDKEDEDSLDSGEYNPYRHRKKDGCVKDFVTFAHILNGLLGVGFVMHICTFEAAGIILGIIGIILLAIFISYSFHMMLRNEFAICILELQPWLGLPGTVQVAILESPKGTQKCAIFFRVVVYILLLILGFTTLALYCLFLSSFLKSLCELAYPEMNPRLYTLILLPFLLLVCLVYSLKILFPLSVLAIFALILGSGLLVWALIVAKDVPKVCQTCPGGYYVAVPVLLSFEVAALVNIVVVLCLESRMLEPEKFLGLFGIFNQTLIVATVLRVLVGSVSSIRFGQDVTLNLLNTLPQNTISLILAKMFLMVGVYCTIPINVYAMKDCVWEMVELSSHHFSKSFVIVLHLLLHVFIVLIFTSIAFWVPAWDIFKGVPLALTVPMLLWAFPAMVELCMCWHQNDFGPYKRILLKDVLLIILAVLCCGFGIVYAINYMPISCEEDQLP